MNTERLAGLKSNTQTVEIDFYNFEVGILGIRNSLKVALSN